MRFYSNAFNRRLRTREGAALIWLIEVSIPLIAGSPVRFAVNNETVTFHGNVFDPIDAVIDQVGEGTVDSPPGVTITVSNVGNPIGATVDNYWYPALGAEQIWSATLWYIDASAPDNVPTGLGMQFEISDITYSAVMAKFSMRPKFLSITKTFGRNFNTTDFPGLQ